MLRQTRHRPGDQSEDVVALGVLDITERIARNARERGRFLRRECVQLDALAVTAALRRVLAPFSAGEVMLERADEKGTEPSLRRICVLEGAAVVEVEDEILRQVVASNWLYPARRINPCTGPQYVSQKKAAAAARASSEYQRVGMRDPHFVFGKPGQGRALFRKEMLRF